MKAVLWKELLEIRRDRRVFMGVIVTPVFMLLLFIGLIGTVSSKVKEPPKPSVGIVGTADKLDEALVAATSGKAVRFESEKSATEALKGGKVRLVLATEGSVDKTTAVSVKYDENEPLSSIAMAKVRETVSAMNRALAEAQLQQKGIDTGILQTISFEAEPLPKEGLGGSALLSLIPYLIVLWTFYGGFSLVSDMVAGEKEKGTMETLLTSPRGRSEIAYGKAAALTLVALASGLSTMVAVVFLASLNLPALKDLFPGGISLGFQSVAALALLLLSLGGLFAPVLLMASARANTIREAQTKLTMLSFLVLLPAIFSQMIGFTGLDQVGWVRTLPVLGASINLKDALLSRVDWPGTLGAAGSNLVLGLLCLWVAMKAFQSEAILGKR